MKRCFKCAANKNESEFSKLASAPDGLQYKCKACAKSYRQARIDEVRQRNRDYYSENRDEIRRKAKESYRANPELVLSRNRAWAQANPEKEQARSRRYYAENRQAIIEYQGRWASANRDKRRKYAKRYDSNHRAQHRAYMAIRAGHIKSSAVARLRDEQVRARMAYFGFRCWMCGGKFQHVDHVKPISRGGPHILANLRPACAPCNLSKGSKWPFDTRSQNHRLQCN